MLIWVGVLATALGAGRRSAVAAPSDGPDADEGAVDAALCADAILADTWNALWAMSFTVTAVGSAGYATFSPGNKLDNDSRAALYVTAAKATAGAIARWVAPLQLDVKDFCNDGRHPGFARDRWALLAEAARREQRTLLPGIIGGLFLNSLGLLYLGYQRHAWENAWLSFGVGTAVAVVSTLTAPTRAWRLNRRLGRPHQLAAMPIIGGDRIGLAIAAVW